MSFSTSYSDIAFGHLLCFENLMNLDDLVHFTLKEWSRMSVAPTDIEVERAKKSAQSWASPRFGRHYGPLRKILEGNL